MPKYRDLPCSVCGKLMWRSPTSLPDGAATCNPCRNARDFEHGTPTGRDRHRHRGEKPCDPCRDAWNVVSAKRQAESRARGWKRAPRARRAVGVCLQCENEFAAEVQQPYCSRACFAKSRVKTYGTDLVHVGPVVAKDAPAVPTTVVLGGRYWSQITSGPCAWCGEQFTALSGSARYCSKRCSANQAKANLGRRFVISPRRRLAIYERDRWVCQLCMSPIDREAHYLADWAPSLDHIEPQSLAIIPDHSDANLRTAHRWCNAVRGNGTYHADLFEEAA